MEMREAEPGYKRLFINLGKRDNFYAREIINLVNRYVKGKVDIGRIDLTANCSFFEVPEEQAPEVLKKMAKAKVGDRKVVVDGAEREGSADSRDRRKHADRNAAGRRGAARKGDERRGRRTDNADSAQSRRRGRDDWKKFFE